MVTVGCQMESMLTCVHVAYTSLQATDVHSDAVHGGGSAATSPLLGCRLGGRRGCCQGQASPHTDVPLAADPGLQEVHLQAGSLRLEERLPGMDGHRVDNTPVLRRKQDWSPAEDSSPA